MSQTLQKLLVAAAITLAIFLLGGREWPLLVVGAALALSLWVMLFAGSYADEQRRGPVATRDYALGAAIGVAMGYVFKLVGDGGAWWAVGFILAGVMIPSVSTATQRAADGD